jgi:hypothetical protein
MRKVLAALAALGVTVSVPSALTESGGVSATGSGHVTIDGATAGTR